MKKGLSLLLAASLAFSTFFSAALAAEDMTAEEKYNALVEAGIFDGFPDGQAHLDQNMTRAQAAKIITLVLDLNLNEAAAGVYTDLAEAQWAVGFIGAATEAGILEGRGDGIFDPSADVSIQELAIIMVRALDIEFDESATVEGAPDWAAPYVKAAIDAGLIPSQSDYTVPASRELLVVASFAAYEQVNAPEEVSALTASQSGARKLTLTFDQAVDSSKATITVKRGSVTTNPSKVTWAEDNKSATLEYGYDLIAADYAITVSGVAANDLTATVKVEASKVTKIEFTSDKLVVDRAHPEQASIGYKVYNQFGEDVTGANAVRVTESHATAELSVPDGTYSSGKIVIVDDEPLNYNSNNTVILTALHVASSTYVSTTATVVAPSRIASVDIVKLDDGGNTLQEGGDATKFKVELDLKDQYGNALTDQTFLQDNWEDDIVQTPNGSSVTFAEEPIVSDGKAYIPLTGLPGSGKTVLTLVSLATGSTDSIELDVKQKSTLDTLMLTAPSLAPKGDTVTIPFTALNQFGEEIKHVTDADITLNVSGNGNDPDAEPGKYTKVIWDRNYVTDTTTLKLNINPDASGTILITGVTKTGKFVQLQFNTVDQRAPESITGVKNIGSLYVNATKTLKAGDNVVIQDQYGSEIAASAGYTVEISTSGDVIELSGNTLYPNDDGIVVTAKKKGTQNVTLTLKKGADVKSSFSFPVTVVEAAQITDYEVTVAGVVYDEGGAGYGQKLTVNGILSDGSKVEIPKSDANYKVTVTGGKNLQLSDDGKVFSDGSIATDKDVEVAVVVTIFGATTHVKTVNVTVSPAEPVPTSLTVVKNDDVELISENYVAVSLAKINAVGGLQNIVNQAVKAVDQYGKELKDDNEPDYNIIVSNSTDGHMPGDEEEGDLEVQDVFTVTAITSNGKIATFKVFVK